VSELTNQYPFLSVRIQSRQSDCTAQLMGKQKLSPQGQRLRIIILTVPIMAATSGLQSFLTFSSHAYSPPVILYKRLVLGEPQRKLPRPGERDADRKIIEFHHEESSTDRNEQQS
jgi:hypothetical protein